MAQCLWILWKGWLTAGLQRKAKGKIPACALIALLVYLSVFWSRYSPEYSFIIDPSSLVLAFVFAFFVVYAVNSPVKKLPFAHSLTMHISTRSYSMYLLHIEALAVTKKLVPDTHFLIFITIAVIITMILSEFLYRFVEMPFLRLRDKSEFSQARSKNKVT
jgi:peptidoglycan/LPS O-acetylase OafA/YrhL